jgi:hypothetical protein
MLDSNYWPLCPVTLPYQGRQKYMHSFDLADPKMAEGYEDYLEPVTMLCRSVGSTLGLAHMTVDEQIVAVGMSQRRPKPHVDGCFIPAGMSWSHPQPTWAHCGNNIGGAPIGRMAVIVAASVAGCKAWRGVFDGQPAIDGDLSHIQNQLDDGEVLAPNVGYLLAPDCVHESMIFEKETKRTFLRIALPLTYRRL